MGDYSIDDPDEKSASFNDALNMINRLDTLIRRVQDSKINPFQMHMQFGVPNFEFRIISLSSHWKEIEPYCSVKEQAYVNRWWSLVSKLKDGLVKQKRNEKVFDLKAYKELDTILDKMESIQRRYQLTHGLSNPLKDRSIGL